MTVVVGLDLSLTATGIATPDGVRTVTSKGREKATLRERYIRLDYYSQEILAAVYAIPDDLLVVVEGPSMGSSARGGAHHDRAGLWWLIVSGLYGGGLDAVEVSPASRAKYATGKGNAGKDEVLAAVVRRYPDVEVTNNNEADALVLRAMGCDWLGEPLVTVPQAHRAALDKVAWPEAVTR